MDNPTKYIGYPFARPVFVLYEGDTEIEAAEEIDIEEEWLNDRVKDLPREGQVVAFRLEGESLTGKCFPR